METNLSNKSLIDSASDVLSKKINSKKLMSSLLFLLIGIACIVAAILVFPDSSSSGYMSFMTVGIIIILVYGGKLLFGSSELVYVPTQSPISNHALFYQHEDLQRIVSALETGNFAHLKNASKDNMSGVRLDIVMSKDNQFAVCQVCKYIPHNYEPVTKIYQMQGDQIAALQPLIRS